MITQDMMLEALGDLAQRWEILYEDALELDALLAESSSQDLQNSVLWSYRLIGTFLRHIRRDPTPGEVAFIRHNPGLPALQ